MKLYSVRFCASLLSAVLFVLTGAIPLSAGAQPTGRLLRNGTFEGGSGEDGRGGGVPEWLPFGLGYSVDRQMHRGGDQSIRCDSLNPNVARGAQSTVLLHQTRPVPLTVSGWSRADQASDGAGSDYSLSVEAEYSDGSRAPLAFAPFRAGTHGWQRRQVIVDSREAAACPDRHRAVSEPDRNRLVRRFCRVSPCRERASSTRSRWRFPLKLRACRRCISPGRMGLPSTSIRAARLRRCVWVSGR